MLADTLTASKAPKARTKKATTAAKTFLESISISLRLYSTSSLVNTPPPKTSNLIRYLEYEAAGSVIGPPVRACWYDGFLRRLLRPFAVYSTWGLHDELGDRVKLTEELAMGALETLRDWRCRCELRFGVFQLDCFWFDAERGYESFDPEGWPNGPDGFLDALRAEGLTLGLWFSVSGLRLNPPEWEASKDPARGSYSLASGPYRESLARSIRGAVQRWGCRYLKLDFADFYADPLGWGPVEAYRRNLSALLELLGQLRAETPGLYVITPAGSPGNRRSPPGARDDARWSTPAFSAPWTPCSPATPTPAPSSRRPSAACWMPTKTDRWR